jgi:site-specific DNA-cytosine methylase
MDTSKVVTHVSLCAGYGGIDLGLRGAIQGLRTIAVSEIEAFAAANLVAKMEAGLMDSAPLWTDLRSFPWESFRDRVDILSGGYPCQPFSTVGKRLGRDDPRHLWPWIADGIVLMRPELCFFENVEGHISLGLRDVIAELDRIGYATAWGIFSAAEVGAPHQRKRIFVLAHRHDTRLEGYHRLLTGREEPRRESPQPEGSVGGCDRRRDGEWPSRPGQPQHEWEPPRVACAQPPLGRDAHGSTRGLGYAELCLAGDNRTDELRLLGNGVVPATCRLAFRTLLNEAHALQLSSGCYPLVSDNNAIK